MDYRYGNHTINIIENYLVWVTKYQFKVLHGMWSSARES